MTTRLCFFLSICSGLLWAQDASKPDYREDQIYLGVGYPFLTSAPVEVTQNKFSHALQLGFVRDMPLNTRRNLAMGVGLGFSYNVVYNNLRYLNESQSFEIIANTDTNLWKWTEINLPLEIRWRTSSAEVYKFWRIYGGVTAIYTFHARQDFRQLDANNVFSDLAVQKFRFALHLSAGNNTWNIYFLHPLNPLFENTQPSDTLQVKNLGYAKIGLIFYIF